MEIKQDDFTVMIAEDDEVNKVYQVTYTMIHKPTLIKVSHTDKTLHLAEVGAIRKMRNALEDEDNKTNSS